MYLNFSSSYPAVIKLSGIYYGTIHDTVKSCKIDLSSPPFIEVCPLIANEKTICFIPNDIFFNTPPENISLTDLNGGYTLKFLESYITQDFSVFAQEKFSDLIVTVFSENGYKISIETPNDFFAESIMFKFNSASINRKDNSEIIYITLIGEKQLVLAYSISGKIRKLFSRCVDELDISNRLKTIEHFNDIAKHKVTTEWEYSNGKISAQNKVINKNENFSPNNLNPKLLPYAFLEEFLIGGNTSEYLAENIKENADKLSGFFGDFIGIMPPPIFRNIDEIGLIYNEHKNKYKVEYFTFKVENNKIISLTKS